MTKRILSMATPEKVRTRMGRHDLWKFMALIGGLATAIPAQPGALEVGSPTEEVDGLPKPHFLVCCSLINRRSTSEVGKEGVCQVQTSPGHF